MANNQKIMAGLDKVGRILSEAKKAGKPLSTTAVAECRQILKDASRQLFLLKAANAREAQAVAAKRAALNKSVKESLIGKADGQKEAVLVSKASVGTKIRARRITASIEAIKRLADQVNELSGTAMPTKPVEPAVVDAKKMANREAMKKRIAERLKKKSISERIKARREAFLKAKKANTDKSAASPRNEELDKGVDTSNQIATPTKVKVTAPGESTPQNVAVDKSGIGNEAELDHQSQMEGAKPAVKDAANKGNADALDHQKQMEKKPAVKMSAKKARAKRMYIQASELLKQAEAEKDTAKKSNLNKRVLMLERMADKLAADDKNGHQQASRPQKGTNALLQRVRDRRVAGFFTDPKLKKEDQLPDTPETIEASTITFAANDQVLLADGVVGKVSAVADDKLTVNVAGIDKEVLADSVKKITSMKKEETAKEACDDKPKKKEKKMSIKEKIQAAAEFMRTGGKKKTAVDEGANDVPIAIADDAPAATVEVASESAGGTVGQTESKVINYVDGIGWTVNKTNNEVVSFGEDKGAAESFVKTMAKKRAQKQDDLIDSANVSTPASQEGIQKNLKGLDQKGKDYGTTSKDEKVNPQTSMIGKAGKDVKATAITKDSPVDSATTKAPEQVDNQKKLKGLDQAGKGYGATSADQKIDPRFSVFARKERILTETTKKQAQRLAVVEAKLLVDRAVKVGTIAEEQRTDQEQVLAELYASSPSEFRAFDRLVATMETNPAKKTVASRTVKKVMNSMENRDSVIVEAEAGTGDASLESGNFFED